MFLILNINYIYVYTFFCKIKNIIVLGRPSTTSRGYSPSTTRYSCLLQVLGRFWDHIGAMDSMVFEVARLDGATIICQTNSKIKGYLLVLNISNCYAAYKMSSKLCTIYQLLVYLIILFITLYSNWTKFNNKIIYCAKPIKRGCSSSGRALNNEWWYTNSW
jgi:hypothetical protein